MPKEKYNDAFNIKKLAPFETKAIISLKNSRYKVGFNLKRNWNSSVSSAFSKKGWVENYEVVIKT